MKKASLLIITVVLALALATSVFAQPGKGRGMGRPGGGPWCDITRIPYLNLTPDQATQINNLREAHWKEVGPIHQGMLTKRNELKQLWLEKNPDQVKIAAKQKEIRDLRDQLQDKRTSYRLQAMKILTPEQQEKIKAANWGCGQGRGKWGGKGMGRGPGQGMGPGTGMGPNQ